MAAEATLEYGVAAQTTQNGKRLPRRPLNSSMDTSHRPPSFVERTSLLLKQTEYSSMSVKDINEQHEKLRGLLKELNEQVARMMQGLYSKHRSPTPQKRDVSQLLDIRKREFENSSAVIIMYKEEFNKLNKRVGELVEKDPLLDFDRSATDIRAKIEKLQVENRDLKRESVLKGKAMVIGEMVSPKIRELRDLETQRVAVEIKKAKLQQDMAKIQAEIVAIKSKNLELQDAYFKAELFFKKLEEREKGEQNSKKLEQTHQQKLTMLESLKKKQQFSFNQLQQRYLNKLKDLENSLANSNSVDEKIRLSQVKIIQYKRLIKVQQNELKKLQIRQTPLKDLQKTKVIELPKIEKDTYRQRSTHDIGVGDI